MIVKNRTFKASTFHVNFCFLLLMLFMSWGCSSEEQTIIQQMNDLKPGISYGMDDFDIDGNKFDDEKKHVTGIAISLKCNAGQREEIIKFLPQLAKLKHLRGLSVTAKRITNEQLSALPPLPNIIDLYIDGSKELTDESLIVFSSMKKMRELDVWNTKITGSGFSHLKGFDQLKNITVHHTPLEDETIPHIVANFPRLEKFTFSETKFTKEGWMQLADLHWLGDISFPQNLVHRITTNFVGQKETDC